MVFAWQYRGNYIYKLEQYACDYRKKRPPCMYVAIGMGGGIWGGRGKVLRGAGTGVGLVS